MKKRKCLYQTKCIHLLGLLFTRNRKRDTPLPAQLVLLLSQRLPSTYLVENVSPRSRRVDSVHVKTILRHRVAVSRRSQLASGGGDKGDKAAGHRGSNHCWLRGWPVGFSARSHTMSSPVCIKSGRATGLRPSE